MKKLLVLLFLLLISFYLIWFVFFEDTTVCVDTDTIKRDGLIYLPNETKPFTGNNLCIYENGLNKSEGKVKDGKKSQLFFFVSTGLPFAIQHFHISTIQDEVKK